MSSGHRHIASSSFHQSNKSHKTGKHESKGTLKKKQKGKVSNASGRVSLKSATKELSKMDKRKLRQEMTKDKKMAVMERRRFGTLEGAPKIVAIVALGHLGDSTKLQSLLLTHCGKDAATTFGDLSGPCTVGLSAKQRMTLFNTPRDPISILDISKVADILLMVVPAEGGIDSTGERLISLIKAQGVPNIFGIIEGLDKIPVKKQHDTKKAIQKVINQHFPEEPRILPLDTPEDAGQVIRFVENCTVRSVHWREKRSYVFVDKVVVGEGQEGELGTVKVSGYVRGSNMSANQLVHIPGVGDFQLKKIEMLNDPFPAGKPRQDMTDAPQVLFVDEPDKNQESMETENVPDLLLNEQTWPTPEELAGSKKKGKKGPKGTSDYQATWIVDEDEERGEGEEEGDEEEGEGEGEGEEGEAGGDEEEDNEMADEEEEAHSEEDESDDELDDAASVMTSSVKSAKTERAEDDLLFPDEVDAPLDKPARLRFQKYRGLKSFRTTAWDPKENLPLEYAKIFQFASISRSTKRAMDVSSHKIPAGSYVTLHIAQVPLSYAREFDPSKPHVVGGLFKYENKMSVLQFNLIKHSSYEAPVASKDSLVFHVGMRRYTCQPIFSALTPGCPKQKFERFLQPGRPSCASAFAPVTFPPANAIVFSTSGELVATGSLNGIDPDRIIVKKIILTGHPFKVHKRGAVVRHMFYFPDDALWFKPVELWTKNGRIGHIKESLGTHGHIKCIFDDPVAQNDTVCLSLYKRVFPKWPKVSPSAQYKTEEEKKEEEKDDQKMDE